MRLAGGIHICFSPTSVALNAHMPLKIHVLAATGTGVVMTDE